MHRPDRSEVSLVPVAEAHVVFGPAYAIRTDARVVALCGAVDWARPRFIPPIDRPAAVPVGAGSAILNVLAQLAAEAGRSELRYRGPYPTAALFGALLHSFRVDDPETARDRFVAGVEARALAGTMDVVDVAFTPAPHAWSWPAPGVCLERRDDRIQRVYVNNRAFAPRGHRRLTRTEVGWTADIVIADEVWCPVLRLRDDGAIDDGPHPIPPVESGLLGTELPVEIAEVLAEVVASRAPRLLAAATLRTLKQRTLVWGDTGDALAAPHGEQLQLHAILGERLPGMDAGRILSLLVDAIEPLARRLAQESLATAVDRLP